MTCKSDLAEIYRQKALSMRTQAEHADTPALRECYRQLAEQWDVMAQGEAKRKKATARRIGILAILH